MPAHKREMHGALLVRPLEAKQALPVIGRSITAKRTLRPHRLEIQLDYSMHDRTANEVWRGYPRGGAGFGTKKDRYACRKLEQSNRKDLCPQKPKAKSHQLNRLSLRLTRLSEHVRLNKQI